MVRREMEFVVRGPVGREDIEGVCARLGMQLAGEAEAGPLVVDVGQLGPGDAVALEAMARIRLVAGRGRPVRFRNVPGRLRELIEWVGLGHLLGIESGVESGVEMGGEAEEGEEVGGLHEVTGPISPIEAAEGLLYHPQRPRRQEGVDPGDAVA
jgi:STAS domain-containing protein